MSSFPRPVSDPTPVPPALAPPSTWLEALARDRQRFLAFVPRGLVPEGDADDVVQEAYVKALTAAAGPRDVAHAHAWFARLVRNVAIDRRRHARAEAHRLAEWAADPTAAGPASAEPEVTTDGTTPVCACLGRSLRTLPPALRGVFQRVAVRGSAISDVATELGVTPNAARVRLHRARKMLRQRLGSTCRADGPGLCGPACACEPVATASAM